MYRESFVRTFTSYDSSHSLSNDCADSVRCPQSPSRSSGSNDLIAVRMHKSNHVESVEEQISVAIRAAQIGLHAIHQKMGTAEQLHAPDPRARRATGWTVALVELKSCDAHICESANPHSRPAKSSYAPPASYSERPWRKQQPYE